MVDLDSSTFSDFIQSEEIVLVDFWAEWCGPCKSLAPELDKIASRGVSVGKVDVDTNSDLAMEYQIMSIPAVLAFKNGEVVNKTVGAMSADKLTEALLQG